MDDWYAETDHLALDRDGVVWILDLAGDNPEHKRLCGIGRVDLPPEFDSEVAYLLDRWKNGFDPEEEARAAYHFSLPSADRLNHGR
jgi:hypothetical protein